MKFFKFILIIWACTVSFSCKQSKEIIPSADFAPYISAFTGGIADKNATIIIQFTEEQPDKEIEKQPDKKLFSFSPSLKGSAHWINNKTLEFIPETGALKQGTTYNVSFALGKIMKVDKQFSKFNFSFKVKESDFAIFTRQLEIQPDETITVRGELSLSDMISMETAKKMITAKIAGKAINVTFEEQNESNKFKFLISGISKEDKAKELNIYVDGAPAKIDRKETVAVEIPAKDIFQLYHQEIAYSPDYKISLIFSNIISESQNLKGLVTVKELKDYTLEVNSNILIIHFSRPSNMKELEVTIDQGLKNNKKESLGETKTLTFPLDQLKPCVELLTSGVIIPDEGKIILPFRAVSLRAVDLKIIRVFENNIFMFLQDNKMDRHSSFQMRRSGRLIYKETLKLDKDFSNWENYSLDLTGIIKQRPGDIYRIELSFKQNYALYECDSDKDESSVAPENAIDLVNLKAGNNFSEEDETFWDTPDDYYYENYDINFNWSQYDWQQRDNPCHPTYYMQNDRKASTNVFVSNIGLIAKINSNNTLWITASDLRDTKPIADAEITVYNFQQQPLATVKTDNSGFAVITLPAKPFAVIASSGNQKAYLRLVDGEENMLSRFDVGGVEINKGLKGFIYGERGVWRPGDTLHIAFMLEDKTHKIPDNHPVSFELFNPRGQFYKKIISSEGLNGLYTFDLPTKPEDPTGLWNAYIKIGGATFHKSLRIETIKPNRLKIKLDVPDIIDGSKEIAPVGVQSSWLTGATASELNVKLDLTLSKSDTQFKGYEKYIFNNPISRFTSSASEVYETKLDNNGKASIDFTIPKAENAPGILKADFICRVFEPGGDASIYAQSLPFSPFPAYIGINFNITDSYLITDQDNVFDIVTLSPAGKPVNLNDLEYNIYRIGWSWWWESQGEQFDSYINNSNYKPVFSGKINTVNGKGKIKFRINYPDWGRYFIYVNDPAGGHGTGGTVLVDWAEWRGRSNKQDPDGIKMLTFAIDKDNYETGDNVTVTIPAVASGGSALLALENGSEVITREWVHLNSGEDTKYSFKVTDKMTPNVYIHISLLQPHKAATDLPIRMYGVKPVFVSDKNTVLNPVITMPDVLKPESVFELKVKEQSGKPMTYTLAIVDDGLLDLTNFKTPDPWNTFYAREALGIRTWDLYDNVMGAFTGRLGSMFSIGGDGELLKSPTKANRFKPVVLFLGPVSLKAGEEKKHSLQLPAYVGSVRAMIVACQEGAYGKADKTAAVRSPLMTLSSLPRILSTDEKINLPVNVFVSEQDLKKVTVKIETEGKLKPIENNVKSINFDATGDQLVYFPMKTGSITGTEKVTITATAGNHTFKETVEIEIRNPNPPVLTFKSKLLEKGESIDYDYSIDKEYDDNRVSVEMSRIPNVDLKGKLDYLHDYYHYCSEQLVSRALPLLYVSDFKNVDEKEKKDINKSVTEAINNLYMRQSMNGGFMYWTGSNTVDEWITSYTGNFLAVAKERGFAVNNSVMDKWVKYQKMKAQNWRKQVEDRQSQSDYIQAYRLYTLALAGSPDLGAMNRLKEVKDIALQSRWRLAAAYSLCGKNDAANELVFNAPKEVSPYSVNYLTYGSSDKDEAMILEALVLLNKKEEAFKQAQKVAANLTGVSYYSTQYFAVAISAMGQFASKFSGNLDFQYTVNGKTEKVSDSKKALYHKDLPLEPSSGKVKIVNGQEGVLYTSISTKSRPLTDNNPEMNNNIRLEVSYTDLKGNTISVDNLEQGTDFNAVIKVSNISGSNDYRNIALTQIIPSGWEIINRNMFIAGDSEIPANKLFTYQDIRDDRVLTYFDLSAGTSKEFKISLQTSYIGDFVLPAVLCEAMYDPSAYARTKAGRVSVVENEGK